MYGSEVSKQDSRKIPRNLKWTRSRFFCCISKAETLTGSLLNCGELGYFIIKKNILVQFSNSKNKLSNLIERERKRKIIFLHFMVIIM